MKQFDCTVIILAHNGCDFTRHNLENLLKAKDYPTEIFVVDNASDDGIPELIQEMKPRFRAAGIRFHTWRNRVNKGCSEARNDAWEKASCKYVVFLDNDAVVCTSNWLSILIEIMGQDETLAILGPKMIYPYKPHPIQCAGVVFSKHGRVCFRGRGTDRKDPKFNEFRYVPALISACWIMRNELRYSIGMLDPLFHPVQYEDLDLCFKALEKGYKVAYTPEVEMYHFEGITTESPGKETYKRTIAENSLKFRKRWHKKFAEICEEVPAEDLRWKQRQELGFKMELDTSLN